VFVGAGGSPGAGVGLQLDAHGRGADDLRGGHVAHRHVVEVDEPVGPALAAGDPPPAEVAAPAVLGDDDLGRGDDLLDVGDVAARPAGGSLAPPGDRPDHRRGVGDLRHRDAPVGRVALAGPGPLVGHAALHEPVGGVVGAVVAAVHLPVHRLGVAHGLVAGVRVAGLAA